MDMASARYLFRYEFDLLPTSTSINADAADCVLTKKVQYNYLEFLMMRENFILS